MEAYTLQSSLILSSVSRNTTTKVTAEDFKSAIKEEARIQSAEEFLYVIRRLHKLRNINPITDLCLFKEGVQPMWEDPSNINGGKWILKVKKNTLDQRLVEKTMLWFALKPFESMTVNGILISIRNNQTILSFWTKECPTEEEKTVQENEIREVLDLKSTTLRLSFKDNQESLKDKSSFRSLIKTGKP
ncbi:translation initiation factor 4E [Nematocida sp. AWRm77]|nr:translation initiation factor 4E [Nematocida sp. AWRm77]